MKIEKICLVCLIFAIILAAVISMIRPYGSKTKNSHTSVSGSIGTEKKYETNSSDINEGVVLPFSSGNSSTNSTLKKNTQSKRTVQNTNKEQALSGRKEVGIQSSQKSEPQITVPKAVDDKANSIAKGEVQASDYIEVLKILQGKLSLSEIKYLFDSASDDYWVKTPVEDIENARQILFSKLSEDDLDKLDQLGRKYGRSMTILKRDIDVAKVKEEQMRKE
ncbi:MAG: hypothetical protein ACM3KR_08110 [Deltaproteobacteria bacterium]